MIINGNMRSNYFKKELKKCSKYSQNPTNILNEISLLLNVLVIIFRNRIKHETTPPKFKKTVFIFVNIAKGE